MKGPWRGSVSDSLRPYDSVSTVRRLPNGNGFLPDIRNCLKGIVKFYEGGLSGKKEEGNDP